MFLDIAVTAEDLLRHHGMVEALVGQHAFQDRRDETEQVICRLTLFLIGRPMGDIGLQRGPQKEGATSLVIGLDSHQRTADIRVHDDRIGLLSGNFAPESERP